MPAQKKQPTWKIPVEKETGNVLHRVYARNGTIWDYKKQAYIPVEDVVVWKNHDYTFQATLAFKDFWTGSSTVHVKFVDTVTGSEYQMTASDFFHMLKQTDIYSGVVGGVWGFAKKGPSYCLQFRGELPQATTEQ